MGLSVKYCSLMIFAMKYFLMWIFRCRLLQKIDFPSVRFSLYFMGYEDKKEIPADVKERTAWTFSRRATIELTQ